MVTALLYGSSYVATGVALHSFSPLGAALLRGVAGALALGVVLATVRHPALRPRRLTRGSTWRLLVLGTLSGPAFIIAMNLAVSLAGASITGFVAGSYAVLAALFAVPLLHERLEGTTIAALVLALVGAGLLAELRIGGTQSAGVGVGMVAAVFFGTFLVLLRRWSRSWDLPGPAVGTTGLGLSAIAAAIGLPLLGVPVAPGPVDLDALAAVAWLALGPGALAAILVVIGMRRLEARRASAFLLLIPPTAAIGSWLLLGETFTPVQVAGAGLVLVAMAAASGLVRRSS